MPQFVLLVTLHTILLQIVSSSPRLHIQMLQVATSLITTEVKILEPVLIVWYVMMVMSLHLIMHMIPTIVWLLMGVQPDLSLTVKNMKISINAKFVTFIMMNITTLSILKTTLGVHLVQLLNITWKE
jgi:hypothetical protein